MPEEKLKIIQGTPKKYHFNTKDNQRVNIEHKDDFIYLNLYKWGEETSLQIVLDAVPTPNHIFSENKIEVENPDFILRVYPIDTRSTGDFYGDTTNLIQCHDGGLRFELVLKKKRPAAGNSFSFPIVVKNLRFNYQPFLTEQDILDGARAPLNVEGSYAVYHATRTNMHRSQKDAEKYKCGKAFHIYRPIAEDALGEKAWCSIEINETLFTLTVPQQFLDEATYPITIDPDFGYTSTGALSLNMGAEDITFRGGSAWTMTENGTANWIKAYVSGTAVTPDCTVFINQKDSVAAGQHGQIATKENPTCSVDTHWEQFNLASENLVSETVYILNIMCDVTGVKDDVYKVYYDTVGATAVSSYSESQTYDTPENPWVVDPGTTRDYSIYCNYSTGAPPIVKKPPMGLGLKAGVKGGIGRPRPGTGGTSFGG